LPQIAQLSLISKIPGFKSRFLRIYSVFLGTAEN
jgi:hypothetical protein